MTLESSKSACSLFACLSQDFPVIIHVTRVFFGLTDWKILNGWNLRLTMQYMRGEDRVSKGCVQIKFRLPTILVSCKTHK